MQLIILKMVILIFFKQKPPVLKWFHDNEMKANEGTVNLGNEEIITETSIKLLGLNIDHPLDFKEHIYIIKKG